MREFDSSYGALSRSSISEKNCHRQLQKRNHRETRDKSADVEVIFHHINARHTQP